MKNICLVFLNLILKIYLVGSASVTFSVKLSDSAIELDCTYKFGNNEKFTSLSMTKNGQQFLQYAQGQDKNPTFTSIPGVTYVKMHGGCRVTIFNYNPDSMGIYELQVLYKNKDKKPAIAKKLYKTSMKYERCTVTWVDATSDALPEGAFLAAIRENGDKFYPCRNMDKNETGYFTQGKGCEYTVGGIVQAVKTFQVLTGKGYSWAIHQGGNDNDVPINTVVIGNDWTGDIYIGRCNYENSAYIGKSTDKFYFNLDGKEVSSCEIYDIVLC